MRRFVMFFVPLGLFLGAASCDNGPTSSFASAPRFSSSVVEGQGGEARFKFERLVGVPRPFTGAANSIRGIAGGGLPWVVEHGEAQLDGNGELRVEVEGLVLDPNDADVIARGLAGNNPVAEFRAVLSCRTRDVSGAAVIVNLRTDPVEATTGVGGGDAEIEETLEGIPDPCLAPIVFVTTPGGNWLAISGF